MFLPVSLSKSKFFTRVTLVGRSCSTRVALVSLVSHLRRTRVASVELVSLVSGTVN